MILRGAHELLVPGNGPVSGPRANGKHASSVSNSFRRTPLGLSHTVRRQRKAGFRCSSDSGQGHVGPEGEEVSSSEGLPSGDWRAFRAKLIAQTQKSATSNLSDLPSAASEAEGTLAAASEDVDEVLTRNGSGLEMWQDRLSLENWAVLASQNPSLAQEAAWAHPTAGPEEGGLLLAAPGMNLAQDHRYWQATVFLLHHSPKGSWGIILNRPSGYTIQSALAQANQMDASLSVFGKNAIYVGGFRSDGKSLYVIHGHDLPGAEEVVPGVFTGGLDAAAEAVLQGKLPSSDFRFFVGRVEWLPGRLQEEVNSNTWYTAACSRGLVLKQCLRLPKPLWREILELMGGEFAETSRREYGEIP